MTGAADASMRALQPTQRRNASARHPLVRTRYAKRCGTEPRTGCRAPAPFSRDNRGPRIRPSPFPAHVSRQAEEPVDPYRVLLWMCVIIAVNQLGFGALIPVLPLYAQSFGVPVSAIGLAIAIYGLARFAIAIPCGRMADQLGRRPTLAIGGLVSLIGNLWCALAPNFPMFLAGRFVAGAGASLVVTIGSVVLADISTPAQRGRMMATYQGAFLFAVGIGPYPGGLLAEHFGLAAPFYVYAAASVLSAC